MEWGTQFEFGEWIMVFWVCFVFQWLIWFVKWNSMYFSLYTNILRYYFYIRKYRTNGNPRIYMYIYIYIIPTEDVQVENWCLWHLKPQAYQLSETGFCALPPVPSQNALKSKYAIKTHGSMLFFSAYRWFGTKVTIIIMIIYCIKMTSNETQK